MSTGTQDDPRNYQSVQSNGGDIPITETPPVWTSPSFWVTVLPTASAVIGFFLHRQINLSGQAAAIGLIAAAVASGLLAIARSLRHQAILVANTRTQEINAAVLIPNRTYAHDDAMREAFGEVGQDMRLHHQRLKKLEDAYTNSLPAKATTGRKTAPKKTTTRRQR